MLEQRKILRQFIRHHLDQSHLESLKNKIMSKFHGANKVG